MRRQPVDRTEMNWILLGTTEGKRQLERRRRGWQGSMRMGLKEMDW